MIINVNGIDLFYEKTGSGEPLIMLHGNGETHEIFDRAVPILAEHFTVYRIDTRGHGQSGPVSEYHYGDMAEDVRCFIEELGLESPVLYGFSDGGIIGLLLASGYPTLLSRLIVSGANLNPRGIKLRWLCLLRLAYCLSRKPKMKLMLKEPDITRDTLGKIDIPVTVLAGSKDIVSQSHTEKIAEGIRDSDLKILQGHDHGSYIVHKTEIAHLILDVCKKG